MIEFLKWLGENKWYLCSKGWFTTQERPYVTDDARKYYYTDEQVVEIFESRNNNAKKKANELFGQFYSRLEHNFSEEASPHEKFIVKQCVWLVIQEMYKLDLKKGAYLETDVDKENYYSFWEDVKKEVELI